MQRIKIHRSGRPTLEQPLGEPMTLGRRSSCEVQLEDPAISREHARIRRVANALVVEDLGGVNGTFLNGRRLAPREVARLANGDRIAIHPFEIEIALGTEPDSEATLAKPVVTAAVAPAPAVAAAPAEPAIATSPVRSHLVVERERIPVWTRGEIEVAVADIIDETHDTKTFRLVGTKPTAFCYKPGHSIVIDVPIDGKVVKRSYSISSTPSRPHALELTVKRCPNGLVSNWLADNARLGQTFKVRGPNGKFSCFEHPSSKLFLLAAGSGVTPLMSMTRWLTDTSADVDIVFLYSVRSPADVIFGRELEYLAARHPSLRVVITATSTRAGTMGWTGISARVDRHLMRSVAADIEEREIFMCGPKPFAEAMLAEFGALGVGSERVRQESFGGAPAKAQPVPPPATGGVVHHVSVTPSAAASPTTTAPPAYAAKAAQAPSVPVETTMAPRYSASPRVKVTPAAAAAPTPATAPPAARPGAAPAGTGFLVRFARSGKEVRNDGSRSLLELGEELEIDLPAGCRGGSCGTCEQRCTSGSVRVEGEEFDAGAREGGLLRVCVAHACSDVVIDA